MLGRRPYKHRNAWTAEGSQSAFTEPSKSLICRVSSVVEQRFCNSPSAMLANAIASYFINVFGPQTLPRLLLCIAQSCPVPRNWVAKAVADLLTHQDTKQW